MIHLSYGRRIAMGKPHPVELRERVVTFVDEGHSHRAAAVHFRVSPRFVNDMIILLAAILVLCKDLISRSACT